MFYCIFKPIGILLWLNRSWLYLKQTSRIWSSDVSFDVGFRRWCAFIVVLIATERLKLFRQTYAKRAASIVRWRAVKQYFHVAMGFSNLSSVIMESFLLRSEFWDQWSIRSYRFWKTFWPGWFGWVCYEREDWMCWRSAHELKTVRCLVYTWSGCNFSSEWGGKTY